MNFLKKWKLFRSTFVYSYLHCTHHLQETAKVASELNSMQRQCMDTILNNSPVNSQSGNSFYATPPESDARLAVKGTRNAVTGLPQSSCYTVVCMLVALFLIYSSNTRLDELFSWIEWCREFQKETSLELWYELIVELRIFMECAYSLETLQMTGRMQYMVQKMVS